MTQISPLNCMTLDLKLGSPSQKGHKKFENMLGASPNWIIRIWPNLQVTNCWESNPLPAMPKSPVSQEYCRGLLMVQPSLFNKAGLLFWAYFLARDCYFCYPLLPPRAGPPPRLYVKCIFPKFQVADAPSKMASSLSSRECFFGPCHLWLYHFPELTNYNHMKLSLSIEVGGRFIQEKLHKI